MARRAPVRILSAFSLHARRTPVPVSGVREVVVRHIFRRGLDGRPQALWHTLVAAVRVHRLIGTSCPIPSILGLLVLGHVLRVQHVLEVRHWWRSIRWARGLVVLIVAASLANSLPRPRRGITADVELRSYWRDP